LYTPFFLVENLKLLIILYLFFGREPEAADSTVSFFGREPEPETMNRQRLGQLARLLSYAITRVVVQLLTTSCMQSLGLGFGLCLGVVRCCSSQTERKLVYNQL
jgi:hypothetical protein